MRQCGNADCPITHAGAHLSGITSVQALFLTVADYRRGIWVIITQMKEKGDHHVNERE